MESYREENKKEGGKEKEREEGTKNIDRSKERGRVQGRGGCGGCQKWWAGSALGVHVEV